MKKCKSIEHPNLAPSWGCCNCNTLNGDHRLLCKHCNHSRCDEVSELEYLILEEQADIDPKDLN